MYFRSFNNQLAFGGPCHVNPQIFLHLSCHPYLSKFQSLFILLLTNYVVKTNAFSFYTEVIHLLILLPLIFSSCYTTTTRFKKKNKNPLNMNQQLNLFYIFHLHNSHNIYFHIVWLLFGMWITMYTSILLFFVLVHIFSL